MAYGGNGGGRTFDNTNKGTLGKNKNKEAGNPAHEKKPDYSGKLNVNGVEFWLSGWLREANGEKFFSLSVQPKEEQRQSAGNTQSSPPQGQRRRQDDDIPF